MISKSLSTSVKRDALFVLAPKIAEFCQFLFVMLVAHADDQGRLPGDEFTVKMQCDPVSRRKLPDFVAALHVLHEVGLIIWYHVEDKKFIQIVNFADHQDLKGHNLRPGKIPACPSDEALIGRDRRSVKRLEKTQSGQSGGIFPQTSPKLSEVKGSEAKSTKEECSEMNSEPTSPTVMTFSTVGPVTTWSLTEAQVAKWQGIYPSLDVLGVCRRISSWCDNNPRKRKTARGMPAFIDRWLSNDVDRGRGMVKPNAQASQIGKRGVVPMGIQDV